MKKTNLVFTFLLFTAFAYAQHLPIDFETNITTSNFIDFDGGTGTVIPNPQSSGINTSATVAQIIRNGGAIWAGSKISLANALDFTTDNTISMKVFTNAPVGTVVKFKLEGSGTSTERDAITTATGAWETLTWDFTGTPGIFNDIVFMFDFGNIGDGTATSTFLFDDIKQLFGGTQIDLPVTFEDSTINYTVTDFEGNLSFFEIDPVMANNHVIKIVKNVQAGASAGTTIGTPAGFASNIPLTLADSKMSVRVWSPDANIPIRLKVEDSNDPTHTCETETNTTVANAWEILVFDFASEAPGTAALSFGLNNGWTYNMASIFMNFGTDGATAGEKTYYFDDVYFGVLTNTRQLEPLSLKAFPNPVHDFLQINVDQPIQTIRIFNNLGQLVFAQQTNDTQNTFDVSTLIGGLYFVEVKTSDAVGSLKFVKE